MNKFLIAVTFVASSGVASAADLPMRSAPPPFVAPLPIFTWTGFYAGVNAGYAFNGDTHFRTLDVAGVVVAPGAVLDKRTLGDDGFTAGGQIGYNYQFGAGNGVVVGIEADAAYTDLSRTAAAFGAVGGAADGRFHGQLDYLGTVRGRIGYAFNQVLIYGTGGFAYGGVNDRLGVYAAGAGFAPAALLASGGVDRTATGYAYGGGIEYALPTASFLNFLHSSAVTVKAEYLHYDLGSSTFNLNTPAPGAGPSGVVTRVKNDGDLIRVGLNYKF